MNLFAATPSSNGDSYLTPKINYGTPVDTLTPTQAYNVQTRVGVPSQAANPWVTAAGIVAATPLDVVDTVASLFPGVQRGQIDQQVYSAVGMPQAADFVRDHKDGIDVTSGILGAVGVGWLTDVALAKMAGSAWATTTGLSKVFNPLSSAVSAAQVAAKTATLDKAVVGESLSWLTGANAKYVGLKAVSSALKASVSEATIFGALHNNEAIWSDDMGTNLKYAILGVGLGGIVGAITGRAAVKRWANSPEVNGAYASAADPTGFERMGAEAPTSGAAYSRDIPKDTSYITSMALNARNADSGAAIGFANPARNSIQNETERAMHEVLQRTARRGDVGVPDGQFSIMTREGHFTPEGRQLTEALHEDPTILHGADSLIATDDAAAALKSRQAHIDDLKAAVNPDGSANLPSRQRARMLEGQTPLTIIDKGLMTVEEAKPFIATRPDDIVYRPTAAGPQELKWDAPNGGSLIMNETGKVNKPIDQLSIEDLISVGEAGNRILSTMKRQGMVLTVPKSADFLQMDFATEFAKRGGTLDLSKSGFTDLQDMRVASLAEKAKRVDNFKQLGAQERYRLNLPQASSVERTQDPTGGLMKAQAKAALIPGANSRGLLDLRMQMQKMTELTQSTEAMANLEGNFFGFNRSKNDGKWMNPVVGFYDTPTINNWTAANLSDRIAEEQAVKIAAMGGGKKAPLVSGLTQTIMQMPETVVTSGISGLSSSQLPGATHALGATASQFLTQAMRNRFTPVLQAAQNIRRVVNRMVEAKVNEALNTIKPFYDQFASISGNKSKILFNQYLSNSAGWDIEGVVQLPDGHYGFQLVTKSESNARRLDRAVQPGELMKNATGVPVVLDQLGNDARMAFESEMTKLLYERNAIRMSRGLNPVQAKDFFTPPPDLRNKLIGFTIDSAGRVVPGGAIIADSAGEFATRAAKVKANLPEGSQFLTREEIKAHSNLWDQADLDFIDPRKMAAPAKHQSGSLFEERVNPRALDHAISYIKQGYEDIGHGTVRTIFDPQLRIAQIRNAASPIGKDTMTRSIWDEYTGTLMGATPGAVPRGASMIFNQVDKHIDAIVANAWGKMARGINANHIQDIYDKLGVKAAGKVAKNFEELADQLGPHMPFKNIVDYVEGTYGVKAPWTAKGTARFMNRIGSAVVLRWVEIPQAAMNMAGIITNMPGLLNARNVPMLGRVGGVPVVDQMRIMARGFKRMTHERSGMDWAAMVKNGDSSQDAMEIHKQLSIINDRSSFMKFLVGNPSASGKLGKLGVEGVASYLTDTSENLSRIWAHFTGLELADLHGITGLEARHTFARQIANDAIANYDPLNRPEIYHSAFGNMYGLFLSYAQNYYQRMFRYIEDEDYKSIGTALGMQASMFGMTSLPGFRQVANLIGHEEDGNDLTTGIYKRFGAPVGNIVAAGGFQNLITLLGIPAVSLNTRGDINFRNPTLDFMTSGQVVAPIGIEVLKDLVTGVWDAVGGMVDPSKPHSAEAFAEALSRTMPNRMLKGAIQVLATGGREVDAKGNVVSETQNMVETIYRSIGLRSARQQAEIEAYFLNNKAQAINASKLADVREATRAMIRSGNMSGLPQIFQNYLDAGGSPASYDSWIRGLIGEATNTRTANQLQRVLRSPQSQVLANRISVMTGMGQ